MFRYFVCTIAFAVSAVFLKAQSQSVIDSLQAVLKHQSGAEKVSTLYELAFACIPETNTLEALSFIEKACEEAEKAGDSLWIVKTKRVKGEILDFLGRDGHSLFEEVLPIAKRQSFDSERLNLEADLGRTYFYAGRYDKALINAMNALQVSIEVKNPYTITAINGVALVYYKLKDYRNALRFYLAAIDSANAVNWELSHVLYANAALCYASLGETATARRLLQHGASLCKMPCPERFQSSTQYACGIVAMQDGCPEEAEHYFLRSYQLARKLGNVRFQLDNISMLSRIYLGRKEWGRGYALLTEAEKLIKTDNRFNLENIVIYSGLSEYYKAVNDFAQAFRYQSKYIALKDSIYSEDVINNLMKAEAGFVQRENDVRIEAQKELIALHRKLLEEQKMRNVFAISVIVMGAIVMYFLYREYRRKETLNALLDERVKARTRELEENRNELSVALRGQDLIVRRVLSGMKKHISTIHGLCNTGRADLYMTSVNEYYDKIDEVLLAMKEFLRNAMNDNATLSHKST